MKNLICALCKTNNNTSVLFPATFTKKALTSKTFSARRKPDRIHYQFLKCNMCGLIFSSPVLPISTIKKLYAASEFTYTKESSYLAETYGNALKKILPQKGREKLKLLDIGCGNGFFLEKAQELGVRKVFGIEPGKALVQKARSDIRKNIKTDLLRPGLFPVNYFDIICCFHTLDHTMDPNEFVELTYRMLKKGGKILFVTHTTNGLSVKLFGEKSPIFDIEHIYLFNEQTLANIFKNHGFTKIQVFNLKNTYPLSYWLHLTPIPTLIKGTIEKLATNTRLAFIPLSLSAGNIGIIAQK